MNENKMFWMLHCHGIFTKEQASEFTKIMKANHEVQNFKISSSITFVDYYTYTWVSVKV
jgi:hypothetical protein